MINLDCINIKFDKQLVENGSISIMDGKITSIIGESGSGKTSILYLLGLISSNNEYRYIFDGVELNLHNDIEMSEIRKRRIGYIFQDNNLVESLNIKDNIKLSATIAGIEINDEEVRSYLDFVKLDIKGECYPKQLSGGERQRVAIACVLAKRPELIIADEPTSALDTTNTELIIDILKNIAYEGKKKIIIATHNPKIQELSDVVYEIRDKKLNLIKGMEFFSHINSPGDDSRETVHSGKSRLNIGFYNSYAKKIGKKGKFQKRIMVALCSIAIAFTSVVNGFGGSFVENQKDVMNKISDREALVVNMTVPLRSTVDVDENLSIDDKDFNSLKSINNISQIYPYYEFRSSGYDIDTRTPVKESTITVTYNNEEKKYTFNEGDEEGYNKFIVIPYFPEQKLESRVESQLADDKADKVYISSELASLLKLDKANSDVSLKFNVCIPILQRKLVMQVGKEKTPYNIDVDLSRVSSLKFDISGILEESVKNSYSDSGKNVIYAPFELLERLRVIEQAKGTVNRNSSPDNKEWKPSAYVTFAKNYYDVETVIDKASSINPNFKVLSSYQNLEAMNTMIDNIKDVASMIVIVILIIIFLLMGIIHMNYTLERKYEISVLKANGFTRFELIKLILAESTRHIVKVTIISTIISFMIIEILNFLFNFSVVDFGLLIVVINLLVAVISIIVPTVISLIVVNRFRPDKIMRN